MTQIDDVQQQSQNDRSGGRFLHHTLEDWVPEPLDINRRAANLRGKIIANMDTWKPGNVYQGLAAEPPPQSLLEDVNAALPTVTITETNKLIYTTATVILEITEPLPIPIRGSQAWLPAWRGTPEERRLGE